MNEQRPIRKYTAEEKNQLEIDKLDEEIRELRSWIRRLLGGVGAAVGVIATVSSVFLAIKSNSDSNMERKFEDDRQVLAKIETYIAQTNKDAVLALGEKAKKDTADAQKIEQESITRTRAALIAETEATEKLTNTLLKLETASNAFVAAQITSSKKREDIKALISAFHDFPQDSPIAPAQRLSFANMLTNALPDAGDPRPAIALDFANTETAEERTNLISQIGVPRNQVIDVSYSGASNPPPAVQVISFVKDVHVTGGWKKTGKDGEMDTDRGDRVPVSATTLLSSDSNRIWLEVTFSCKEDGGNKTGFAGTRTYPLFEVKDGHSIGRINFPGKNPLSFNYTNRGETHSWRTFPAEQIKGTYWNRFGYVIDTPKKDDSDYVGVLGRIAFTYEIK